MTIKETAGKILLYFYQLQRTVPASMQHRQIGFLDKKDGGVSLTSDKKWLTKDLQDINPSSSDIYNGFLFLLNKGFIKSKERSNAGAKVYMGIELADTGIDIIEGVEYGSAGKEAFMVAFNIKVHESMDTDALIKDNLKTLLN